MTTTITKPATPAVLAISQLPVRGNITPHLWYLRSEFRNKSGRIDRNMITVMGDILYWYRGEEVRDEEHGGAFVGYQRKFASDMLQYDYGRRAAVLGMSKREMQDACSAAVKKGLIRIDYRTERYKGKLLHNMVHIEPVAEAVAATLKAADVGPVEKGKQASRGRHIKQIDPNAGIDGQGDEAPEGLDGTSLNLGTWPGDATSLNLGTSTSLNLGSTLSKFRDTYYESSFESSCVREKRGGELFARASEAEAGATTSGPAAAPAHAQGTSSSSFSPAAQQPPEHTRPEAGNGAAPGQQVRAEVEQRWSPDGEASPLVVLKAKMRDDRPLRENVHGPAPQDVPGAAGGAATSEVPPRGPWLPLLPASVLEFAPVPTTELESRLPGLPGSEAYRQLEALLGRDDLPTLLGEKTRSSGIPRERWLRLSLDEVQAVETVAVQEHAATKTSLRTLLIRGLDRLIGSPWTGQKKPAASAAVSGGRALEPARKPVPEPEFHAEGKLLPGAQYRRKSDGAVVELLRTERVKNKSGDGEKWVLSDSSLVGALDLVLKFEFVGRPAAPQG